MKTKDHLAGTERCVCGGRKGGEGEGEGGRVFWETFLGAVDGKDSGRLTG